MKKSPRSQRKLSTTIAAQTLNRRESNEKNPQRTQKKEMTENFQGKKISLRPWR